MSTYTGVTNCQKQSGFLAHPVFTAPRARRTPTRLHDPIQGIERLSSIKEVLGVIVNDQLTTSDHVTELIATFARTLCAIYELCEHMDSPDMPFILFSRLLSKPDYRTLLRPSLVRFLYRSRPHCLDSFLRRCRRLSYCDVDTSPIGVPEQCPLADEALFERVQNDDRHVLRLLTPPRTEHSYNLRRRLRTYREN